MASGRSGSKARGAGPGTACHHQHGEHEKQETSYADDLEEAMNYAKNRSNHAKSNFCAAAKKFGGFMPSLRIIRVNDFGNILANRACCKGEWNVGGD